MDKDTKKLINTFDSIPATPRLFEPVFTTNKAGTHLKSNTVQNIAYMLELHNDLSMLLVYNQFSNHVELSQPWHRESTGTLSEKGITKIKAELEKQFKQAINDNTLLQGLTLYAESAHPYHPLKKRIEQNEWDGIPRVERYFISHLGVNDEQYSRDVTRKWFVGLIARIYQPGTKFEIVPALVGEQGVGKSESIRALFPDYYLSIGNNIKDQTRMSMLLQDTVIGEFEELAAARTATLEEIKAFISARQDKYVGLFAKIQTTAPRHTIFIATSNDQQFIYDKTGARRWFPLVVHQSQIKQPIFKVDDSEIQQVLAEAKHIYDAGTESLAFTHDEMQSLVKPHTDAAQGEDAESDLINDVLDLYFIDAGIINELDHTPAYDDRGLNKFISQEYPDALAQYPSEQRDDGIYITIPAHKKYVPLNNITATQLLALIHGKSVTQAINLAKGGAGKKIGLIVDSRDDWDKSTNTGKRGYIRPDKFQVNIIKQA